MCYFFKGNGFSFPRKNVYFFSAPYPKCTIMIPHCLSVFWTAFTNRPLYKMIATTSIFAYVHCTAFFAILYVYIYMFYGNTLRVIGCPNSRCWRLNTEHRRPSCCWAYLVSPELVYCRPFVHFSFFAPCFGYNVQYSCRGLFFKQL